jgi:hypothetical protein
VTVLNSSLCNLCFLCVSVVRKCTRRNLDRRDAENAEETQRVLVRHRDTERPQRSIQTGRYHKESCLDGKFCRPKAHGF